MSYEIFNEDCLQGMKRIPDGSVDCIICDPPYNVTECAWDLQPLNLDELWTQFNRVLKPYRSAVMFASGKFVNKLIASNAARYKYKWIWVKNAPTMFIHAKNAPMHKFEEILVFSDGVINHASCTTRRMKYNPQGLSSCKTPLTGEFRSRERSAMTIRGGAFNTYVQEQTGYPSDVLTFDVMPSGQRDHPTQKPVDLLEYLIKTYTDEGELVLDATMGSGSTGVAAINTGRRFIGFELEEKFFEIARRRIDEAIAKRQSLF